MSVMLHSVLLAAVFAIGSSSLQQTKRLLIVSLFDEWQQGDTLRPAQGLSTASASKRPVPPVKLPAQNGPWGRVSPDKAQDSAAGAPTGGVSAPSVQTPPALSEKSVEPAGIPGGTDGGPRGKAMEGRQGTAIAGSRAISSGSSGRETGSGEAGFDGREQQAEDSDPALRRSIRAALQANLVYPYLARKKRIEGTVLAEFRLNNSGMPESMRIVRTSNYAILDEAAKETIQRAAPFPAQNRRVEIPISFRLKDRD